jgi:hypothetical protein
LSRFFEWSIALLENHEEFMSSRRAHPQGPSKRKSPNRPNQRAGRPRPAFLRALGAEDPPLCIQIHGETFTRLEIFKHDSWAATALYAGASMRAVCKFNRQAPLFGLSVAWLGHRLASRETKMLERLGDAPNVPRWLGVVKCGGRRLEHAVARTYIPGHPLSRFERVDNEFFPTLKGLLDTMHSRGMAYVDLHKRENIIVGDDGQPYLVDFQIGANLPARGPWNNPLTRALLRLLQQSDTYHLLKHMTYNRPDLVGFGHHQMDKHRPWWIWLHRFVTIPPRVLRRVFLVLIGVRRGKGAAVTEHFAEDAIRRESYPTRRSA